MKQALIIGSGIGGLVCGGLLAKEGWKITILEKNKQIGGALQTYARDKILFDAGVHYMGGLAPGQNLYQIFHYLGIMDKLRLVRMEEEVFDKILIGDDPREFKFAQGYDRFVGSLAEDFPAERAGIQAYSDKIREVCARFPSYNLRSGGVYKEKEGVLGLDTKDMIESFISDPTLREVLAGNTILYAGEPDKTPFYVHALILNSFIESSWKCVDGGSQLSKALATVIREHGGELRTRANVVQIGEDSVTLSGGETLRGPTIISSLHPAQTLALTPSERIKTASRTRIAGLENSISCFCVNLVLKPGAIPYVKHNCYYHDRGAAWTLGDYTTADWPRGYALFLAPARDNPGYAASATLMTYMRFEDVAPWADTVNTTSNESDRGATYETFKKTHYERLMDAVGKRFSNLISATTHWYASTPLSFRDYLGTPEGTLYGIVKDYRVPVKTIIPARTKVPNLF